MGEHRIPDINDEDALEKFLKELACIQRDIEPFARMLYGENAHDAICAYAIPPNGHPRTEYARVVIARMADGEQIGAYAFHARGGRAYRSAPGADGHRGDPAYLTVGTWEELTRLIMEDVVDVCTQPLTAINALRVIGASVPARMAETIASDGCAPTAVGPAGESASGNGVSIARHPFTASSTPATAETVMETLSSAGDDADGDGFEDLPPTAARESARANGTAPQPRTGRLRPPAQLRAILPTTHANGAVIIPFAQRPPDRQHGYKSQHDPSRRRIGKSVRRGGGR